MLEELRASDGKLSSARASRSRWRPSATPRATTPRSRAGSPSARRTSPPLRPRVREGARPLLRGEPAPARRLLRRGRRPHAPARPMVSKLHGKELSYNNLLDLDRAARLVRGVRGAGRRDHQAQQPLRLRGRRDVGEAFERALATRPGERLRRHLLLQPPGRRGARREAARDLRRAGLRARATTRRLRGPAGEAEHPHPRDAGAAPRAGHASTTSARPRRAAGAGPRHRTSSCASEMAVATRAQADRGGVGRAAVRLAVVQARALERDRAGAGAWPPSGSAPAR